MFGLLPRGTFTALVLAAIVYAGIQYVPVYFNAWQFYDAVRQEVRFAGTSRRSIDSVQEAIVLEADRLSIPIDDDGIQITPEGPFFVVEIRYDVPVDLRVYQDEVSFDWRLSGETFQ